LAASPFLYILAVCRSIWCILCFSTAKSPEGVYIVGFRSRRVQGANVCDDWTQKVESGPYHVARLLAYMVGPLFGLMAFPFHFFSISSICWKNDMAKKIGSIWHS
jgi:hypothetical protein